MSIFLMSFTWIMQSLLGLITKEHFNGLPWLTAVCLVSVVLPCVWVLFFSVQVTLCFFSTMWDKSQRVAKLDNDDPDLQERLAKLDMAASPLCSQWVEPSSPHLIRSTNVSPSVQFIEFGEPPPLDEDDDLQLPRPAMEGIQGHAALEHFYRSDVL